MSLVPYIAEPLATACNIGANAIVLHTMCRDRLSPVPKEALAAQVLANVSWIAFALSRADPYLCITALASLGMQASSLWLRTRNEAVRVPMKSTGSNDALVQRSPSATNRFPF